MTTKELCRQIGITLREAQWWCDTGVLRPKYVGHSRSFEESEALVALMVAELRRKGVPLQKIRRLPLRKPPGDFLVSLNGSALWCSEERVIPCVAEAPGPCLVLAVKDLRRRLYE